MPTSVAARPCLRATVTSASRQARRSLGRPSTGDALGDDVQPRGQHVAAGSGGRRGVHGDRPGAQRHEDLPQNDPPGVVGLAGRRLQHRLDDVVDIEDVLAHQRASEVEHLGRART